MKGIILASVTSVLYAAAVVAVFRIRRPDNRAGAMFKLYLASLPLLAILFVATPPDLWVLSVAYTESEAWVEGFYSVFIYSASVLGGWLQLYNLAERGLSLRILIDALERPDRRVDADFIVRSYGAGKGIAWMYAKRTNDLLRLGLIREEDTNLVLSEAGLRNARLLRWLRSIMTIGASRVGTK